MKTISEETYAAINAILELNLGYTKADAFRVYARQKHKKEAAVSFAYYQQQRKINGRRPSRGRPRKAESTTLVAQPVVTPTVNGTTDVFGAIGLSLSQISAEYGRINRENREMRAKLDAIEKVCREHAS